MSFESDLAKVLDIKKGLYVAIKDKTEIESDTPFEEYRDRVLSIKVDTGEVRPYFDFYQDPPRVQNYVFGGGVEASFQTQYFFDHFTLASIDKPAISVGEGIFGKETVAPIDIYLSCKDIDTDIPFIRQPPTITENVFPMEE